MTKITRADIECWKAIFDFDDEHIDVEGDDKRGLELLAAHREAAFEAGRAHEKREVIEWLRQPDVWVRFSLAKKMQAAVLIILRPEVVAKALFKWTSNAIENKEHRNDAG